MNAIDLFAGAGGFTEGAEQAGCRVLWAANHWGAAVETHHANHPATAHACQDLQQADWGAVPRPDIILASPCCQGHTNARGKGRNNPAHDVSRSTAWAVVSALEYLRPPAAIVENVVEFQEWTLFPAWRSAVEALGYALSFNVIDAADLGVPQHRIRLFIVMTRSRSPLKFRLRVQPLIPASTFVDFEGGKWSPIEKEGRSPATLRRVENGRREFGRRFVMPYYGSGSGLTGRSLDRPIGTLTTRARWAVVDGDRMRMLIASEERAAMSFRSTYILPAARKVATHLVGNAVCPRVGKVLISALRAKI